MAKSNNERKREWRKRHPHSERKYKTTWQLEDRIRDKRKHWLYNAKKGAKRRGIEWGEFSAPVPLVCPVLGIPLDRRDQDHIPTLDRVDNTKGYVAGNVVVISFRANVIKNKGTAEEHRKIADYIDAHNTTAP